MLQALEILKSHTFLGCSVCYAAVDSPMTRGLAWAIITLLGILCFIFIFLGKFMYGVYQRSKQQG